jgi:UDP-GlcNAc3NAcA epimerase
MSRPTLLTVVGNRPQFIKCAVVSALVRAQFHEVLLDTGQHYDHELAGIFYDQLDLPQPDISLGVGSGSHAEQTAHMLIGIEKAIVELRPGAVLVYGDTNSTLAGALAAAKLCVPVAHVEAGLRSFDRRMPEEVNRVVADHVATILFCPTDTAVANLRREGIEHGVHKVGDVMFDLAERALTPEVEERALSRFGVSAGEYVMATLHRPVNVDSEQRLAALLGVFGELDERVVFPAHPRTRASIARFGLERLLGPNVVVLPPVGYFESLALVKNARVVATDSGGMQKEAYFFGTPCVTMRDTSEWVETLESGWNVLVGADPGALAAALAAAAPGHTREPYYGEGDAGERIVAVLRDSVGG